MVMNDVLLAFQVCMYQKVHRFFPPKIKLYLEKHVLEIDLERNGSAMLEDGE